MQVVDGTDDLCAVEPRSVFGKDSLALEVEVELAAVDVLGDETQPVGRGERVSKGQQERVVDALEREIKARFEWKSWVLIFRGQIGSFRLLYIFFSITSERTL